VARRRVLLVVENAPVPDDRRVWNEAQSLRRAGYAVAVLAPSMHGSQQPRREVLEGVDVHRFPLRQSESGVAGFLREYALAMWHIWRGIRRVARSGRLDVVHAANPPDFLLAAALAQRRRGTALIFDRHDLVPEMLAQRFGSRRALRRLTVLAERAASAMADVTIATNESIRAVALARGRVAPQDAFVVRNGPRLDRFTAVEPDRGLARGRAHLLVYEGVIGATDGVDHALHALAALRDRRTDWHALFLGDGDMLPSLRALTVRLDLEDRVEFAGYVADATLRRALCSADVCLAPDPRNPLTDRSTLVKLAEYMAMGRAIVSFDLTESRVTAGEAAVFVAANDPIAFARAIDELLDDPERRREMGRAGRARVERALAWEHSERTLVEAYERALSKAARRMA
jgi:glycosyltransferase involved in cell wall biosynthesis